MRRNKMPVVGTDIHYREPEREEWIPALVVWVGAAQFAAERAVGWPSKRVYILANNSTYEWRVFPC